MQIPILNGVYTTPESGPDFRTAYPKNLVPVPKEQGVSKGYLRPAEGIALGGITPGPDRGGIRWNNVCYRVAGSTLISISSTGLVSSLGNVGTDGSPVIMTYGFDYLAIASAGSLYYYKPGSGVQRVTDTDLGLVNSVVWADGYYLTTDGNSIICTDLNNPFSINPLRYGSSESDPDPIVGFLRLRREVLVLNRFTIELLQNVGGTGSSTFPFASVPGAIVPRGAVGAHGCCVYEGAIAFLGSGRDESISVFLASGGDSAELASREVAQILNGYTEEVLAQCVLESRNTDSQSFLYLQLPDRTLVYDHASSQVLGEKVWHVLSSSLIGYSQYRARDFVWCYGDWIVGDPTSGVFGYISAETSHHYGVEVGMEFGTLVMYNDGNNGIVHELELVTLSGGVANGVSPTIWTSYSNDGKNFSVEKPVGTNKIGQNVKRIMWLQQGMIDHWRIQKFRTTSAARMSFLRLEAVIEPLNNKKRLFG
jgi:hypothetical protein